TALQRAARSPPRKRCPGAPAARISVGMLRRVLVVGLVLVLQACRCERSHSPPSPPPPAPRAEAAAPDAGAPSGGAGLGDKSGAGPVPGRPPPPAIESVPPTPSVRRGTARRSCRSTACGSSSTTAAR